MDDRTLSILTYAYSTLNLFLLGIYLYIFEFQNTRRWWIRPLNRKRSSQGFYTGVFMEMKETDHEEFFKFTRMWPHQFDKLLQLVSPQLMKHSIRTPIPPEILLVITLSYLAQGDSSNTKAWEFRVGKLTTRKIIHEVCRAIGNTLQPIYLPPLNTNCWKRVVNGFQVKWQFPHCLGALDGCHIPMQCPSNSGSSFFCFKKYFSINLMAICDADYKFTWVNVEQYGSISDSGVWANTVLAQFLEDGQLQLPPPQALPGSSKIIPYFFVADEGFPLKKYIMHPYSRRELGIKERVFNYRLSRARRIIENSFGILLARWRILRKGLNCSSENATYMVNALVCLHNFLMTEEDKLPRRFKKYSRLDVLDQIHPEDIGVSNFSQEGVAAEERRTAQDQRDILRNYFISPIGEREAPWQYRSALGAFNINIPNPF